ncbi:MAG: outer membrane protein assembly factor BamB family protein [Planctomycetota bacterium]|jgi:outer membrane protein assembly factor BamB
MKNIVLIFICLFLAVPSQAEIIIVDEDWPYDFDNIQAAIDYSTNGDIIVVFPGTYTGPGNYEIDFNGKSITVQSVDPQDPYIVAATIIDCNNLGSGFSLQGQLGTNYVIDGFTIINGYTYNYNGGGIWCQGVERLGNSSTLTISNCNISNNTASSIRGGGYGGGISVIDGIYLINNCTINGNSVPYDGAGGGIHCGADSDVTITNSTIFNNSVYDKGGGIYCDQSKLTLINCAIIGNTANCTIIGYPGSQNGGGLYCSNTLSVINNCAIIENLAGNHGGGIFCDEDSYLKLNNSILWANTDTSGTGQSAQIHSLLPAWPAGQNVDIIYSCIQDDDPSDSNVPFGDPNHNIDDDPMFARDPNDGGDGWGDDPETPGTDEGANDDFGDLHLQGSSPCINAGFPNLLGVSNSTDIDGQPRIIGGRIDMGVDEFELLMIAVTKPKTGEVWIQNSSHEIKWTSCGISGTVDISYSSNYGVNWTPVENNVANTGSYLWQLPAAVNSNQCLVSIVPRIPDPNAVCINSGPFTIKPDFIHPAVSSTWKTLGGDFDRTGLSQSHGPELGCVKWQFETTARVSGSVTIGADNRVHIACEDGKLYTINSADGSLVWTYNANSPLLSSPTVGPDGSTYIGDKDGKLHVVSISGNLRWTHNTDGFIYSSPAISNDGKVYLCSQDGKLYALGADGSELWTVGTNNFTVSTGSILASPTIDPDGTVYIAGLYDPNLYAINPNDGSLKWACTFDSNGWPLASPVIAPDAAIYQTLLFDPNLYAIDAATGTITWSTDLADPCSGWFDSNYIEGYATAGGCSEPALGQDGTIYANLDDPYLRAVDPNGTIKWVTRLGARGGFTLIIGSDGLIYAAGDDGYLCVLDNTGAELARFQSDGDGLNFPVIAADNTIIISDSKDNTTLKDPPNNIVRAITGKNCQGPQYALHRPEDINANRTVNLGDFALLAADWLLCTDENCSPLYNPLYTGNYSYVDHRIYLIGDINRNLYLDFEDLEALANNWLSQE